MSNNSFNRGHSFSVNLALEIGVEKAVIVNTISILLENNENKKNIKIESLYKNFPYIEEGKFNKLLKDLIRDGYIMIKDSEHE